MYFFLYVQFLLVFGSLKLSSVRPIVFFCHQQSSFPRYLRRHKLFGYPDHDIKRVLPLKTTGIIMSTKRTA